MTGTDDGEFYSHSGDPGYSGLADDEEEAAVEDPEFLQVQAETSTELPGGDEAFGDWAEPEPKELRGFFGRGRHGRGEDVNVDDSTEVVWDDDPVGIAASEVPADFLDTDQAAPPDFGGLFEPITEESILATEVPSVESIPLEQPAIMEMVPVGATVRRQALRMSRPCF